MKTTRMYSGAIFCVGGLPYKAIVTLALLFTISGITGAELSDMSFMDTAVTLKPGQFKVAVYAINEIRQTSWTDFQHYYTSYKVARGNAINTGLRFGIGITDGMELNVSTLREYFPFGRASMKLRLVNSDGLSIAVVPGIHSYKWEDDVGDENSNVLEKTRTIGAELPVIITRIRADGVQVSTCMNLGYNYSKKSTISDLEAIYQDEIERRIYALCLVNVQLKYKWITFCPELGMMVSKGDLWGLSVMPRWGLSVGLTP